MANMAAPACVHVYDLKEGKLAKISWDTVAGAEGYIVKCLFNKAFEQADEEGRTWDNFEIEGCTFDELEAKNRSWVQWAFAPLAFVIYRGFGMEERGSTWKELDEDGMSWDMIHTESHTWSQFENLLQHRSIMDEIAFNAKTAIYRVAAYDSAGAVSDYTTSYLVSVEPAFYRENAIQWHVTNGKHYWLTIEGEDLREYDRVPLALRYDASMLCLEDFIAHIPDVQMSPGTYPSANLRIEDISPGKVRFRCIREAPTGKDWSGCITIADFIAIQTGLTEITLC